MTFKDKYERKYGEGERSLDDIAKETKIKKSILQEVYNRGYAAATTSPKSVRNKQGKKRESGFPKAQRMSPEQWGMARVYGFVGRNRKQIADGAPDRDLYLKTK
jgi:hypothetical protein